MKHHPSSMTAHGMSHHAAGMMHDASALAAAVHQCTAAASAQGAKGPSIRAAHAEPLER